jgi:epoxide hydrolase 4
MYFDHDTLKHEYVNANGIRIHCVTMGDGDGPLIVFLHGFPEFWYSWRHQIPFFAQKFKVVAPDMRGYGDTDKPKEIKEYKIGKLSRDIIELIHSFGNESAIIVGHDWGGIIGWSIAMIAPNVVEKLIVMNAPHPSVFKKNTFRNLAQMQKSWYIFFFLLQKVPEKVLSSNDFKILRHFFESSIKRKDRFTQGDIEEYVSAWRKYGSNGLTGGINYYRANLVSTFWKSHGESTPYPKIRKPTLMIWGENDSFLGIEMTENTQKSVEAPFLLKLIPGCGHWVQQEAPDEVNQIMDEFLNY